MREYNVKRSVLSETLPISFLFISIIIAWKHQVAQTAQSLQTEALCLWAVVAASCARKLVATTAENILIITIIAYVM